MATKAATPKAAMSMPVFPTSVFGPVKPTPPPPIYTEVRSAGFEDLNDFMQKSLSAYGNSKEVKIDIDRLAKILEPAIPVSVFQGPPPVTSLLPGYVPVPLIPSVSKNSAVKLGTVSQSGGMSLRTPTFPGVFPTQVVRPPPPPPPPTRGPLVLTGNIIADLVRLGSELSASKMRNSSVINNARMFDMQIRSAEMQVSNLERQLVSAKATVENLKKQKDASQASSKDALDSMKLLSERYAEMQSLLHKAQKRKVELDDLYSDFLKKEAERDAEDAARKAAETKAAENATKVAADAAAEVAANEVAKATNSGSSAQTGGGRRKKVNKTRIAGKVWALIKKRMAKTLRRRRA